jgi:hypothetical protein
MSWKECDRCHDSEYTPENPFVEYRQKRPSDPTDMCCTLAGHLQCFSQQSALALPIIGNDSGVATPEQWQTWIEGEGAKLGFAWIT